MRRKSRPIPVQAADISARMSSRKYPPCCVRQAYHYQIHLTAILWTTQRLLTTTPSSRLVKRHQDCRQMKRPSTRWWSIALSKPFPPIQRKSVCWCDSLTAPIPLLGRRVGRFPWDGKPCRKSWLLMQRKRKRKTTMN